MPLKSSKKHPKMAKTPAKSRGDALRQLYRLLKEVRRRIRKEDQDPVDAVMEFWPQWVFLAQEAGKGPPFQLLSFPERKDWDRQIDPEALPHWVSQADPHPQRHAQFDGLRINDYVGGAGPVEVCYAVEYDGQGIHIPECRSKLRDLVANNCARWIRALDIKLGPDMPSIQESPDATGLDKNPDDAGAFVPAKKTIENPPDNTKTDKLKFLTTEQVADLLQIKPQTLAKMRMKGRGPAFTRVGRAIRYSRVAVEKWLKENGRGLEDDA